MTMRARRLLLVGVVGVMALVLVPLAAWAQETLGAINGTVTDTSNAVVRQAQVQAKNLGTGLTVNATTSGDGSYNIVDLPIGTYSVTISKQGFKTEVHSNILVRGNLATTVNAVLQAGEVSSTVTVSGTPLLNQTDTTNGYTLGTELIQNTPLGTGSFTQLAVLAPGVSADLLSGSGTASGLGNQDIFANGQRDTSNGFAFNGVDVNNLFNGMTSSSVGESRFVLNTGEKFQSGGQIQTSTSVYDAIGEGLPSPAPETIQELHVDTSMYGASEGAYSGAQVQVTTKSGTNDFHGQVYEYHQTDAWDANQFFFNAAGVPRPPLHRNTFGGALGGPIIHNKMFFFGSYQGSRVHDNTDSESETAAPPDLTNDRSAAALEALALQDYGATLTSIDPVALALMNAKLPNGTYLIPTPNSPSSLTPSTPFNTIVQGPAATLIADQFNANLDYDFGAKDRLAEKYFFQRDPTTDPFPPLSSTGDQVLGFPQQLSAGAQTLSLDNATMLTPNLTWEQRGGFIRETAFTGTSQPFGPSNIDNSGASINLFGSPLFPGITVQNMFGNAPACSSFSFGCPFESMYIGPTNNFANAGIFQNQFEGATNLTWLHGSHSFSFGFQWDHNQLNVVNKNDETANLAFTSFTNFLEGNPRHGTHSLLLDGSTDRYFRSNQAGLYAQDVWKVKSNLSVDLGVRWDWDGPLSEEHGLLTNFYPQDYSYNLAADTINNIGLVVANSSYGSPAASPSTLTGRQWGFAPRIGVAWSPSQLKNVVVRTGFGLYYDRGEYFTELGPSAGFGISGPFAVTTEEPFVVQVGAGSGATFENPFGTTAPAPPPTNLSGVKALIPNEASIENDALPLLFAGYNPANTLPYSENWTLDFQWQPTNTLLWDVGYVGNHGVHQVLPIPFNQPEIATPTNPVNGQIYSYGFEATDADGNPGTLLTEPFNTFEGGNTDLRVPYIGFNPNSAYWSAEGISNYNALQLNLTKRMSYGLLFTASYTWSHVLDEGGGLSEGLFYNGNNPLDPRSAYGTATFDRTHVFNISYQYQLPKVSSLTGFADKIVNGWGISGITVAESGTPYSVYDFSGDVGSQYWGAGNDYITNPLLTIVNGDAHSVQLQGTTGVNAAQSIINANDFGVTVIPPGTGGVPPCGPTTDEAGANAACDYSETQYGTTGRNLFRGPFQLRFDFGVFKEFKLSERFTLRYDAQFFNIFNHPSFDAPMNDFTLDSCDGPNVATSPYGTNPNANVASCVWGGSTQGTNPVNGMPLASVGATPSGLGLIQDTLGSPRFIQMALHLTF
jgi:hypothetical protein